MFRQELLKAEKLPRVTINGSRHYQTPNGLVFPSVTTVLKSYYKKPQLVKWRKRLGEKKANAYTQQAANRGKSLHTICEHYLENDPDFSQKTMPSTMADFERVKDVLDNNVSVVMGVEFPIFSEKYKTAGTADLLCTWGNVPSIVDYKTSKKFKKEEWIEDYFVQSSVYALMSKDKYGIDFNQIVVILLVEHCNPQVFIKNVSEYEGKVNQIFISSREGTQ